VSEYRAYLSGREQGLKLRAMGARDGRVHESVFVWHLKSMVVVEEPLLYRHRRNDLS
jgi:hypothetical protein